MNLRYIISIITLAMALVANAQLVFTGNNHELYEETPAANTGLNKIYVLYDTQGVGMQYTASTENPVAWYTYGDLGGGYAEEITVQHDGLTTTLDQLIPNKGYIIEEGTSRMYVWVVNYADYLLQLNGITAVNDGDCSSATLNVNGSGPDIAFFSLTGVRNVLDRGIKLCYNNLVWDPDDKKPDDPDDPDDPDGDDDDDDEDDFVPGLNARWVETPIEENQPSFKPVIVIPAPTENTVFTLTGDKFLKMWGEEQSVESNMYNTACIDVRCVVTQENRHHDNEKKTGGGDGLGGSAPAHITFKAYCTDAVVHKEWQMSRDYNFSNIDQQFLQEEVEQDFVQEGITYWRFYATNESGECEYYSDTYTVNIGESELVCPNVFTPGTSQGVNDVWKVSYRSIVKFHCDIFNRWGNLIRSFDDPSDGWDGKYRGKLVDAGVYYYVIQAEGSDGKKYKLSGDINIIRYKLIDRGGSNPVGGGE